MNKKVIWSSLLLLTFVIAYPASSEGKFNTTQNDSLVKALNSKKGIDKISAQLDLALQIMGNDGHEALSLAKSALGAVKTANNKSLEMRAYFTLGRVNQVLDIKDVSLAYLDTALNLSEVTHDNWYKGEILFRKGVIKHSLNEDITALEYFNASIQACRLSNNFKVMGSSYSMMGTIFRVNGLYDRAIEYIINSRLNYEKAGFSEGKAWAAYLLGRIYADLKLSKKALEYFQEALEIYTQMATMDGNQSGVALCYSQIGLLNLDAGNFNEAYKDIDFTLKTYTATKDKYGLSNAYKNLGMIDYAVEKYKLAETHLNESFKIKKEVNDFLGLPSVYEYLGLSLIEQGQKKEGFDKLRLALTLAKSNNQKSIQLNIYSRLTKVYLKMNDLENAIICQKKQIEIQDSLLSGDADIKMEQLQAIYEIDKQNGQILELEKQNQINTLIIQQHRISQLIMITGIIVAILISILIYWFYTKMRHKNLELKESNAAKDKFFAIIAHDLRGPTGNLATFLEHINDTFNEHSPDELKTIVSSLYKSAENVSALLENLLIWAQSQLNKIEHNPTVLHLADVVQNSIKGLKQIADDKQIDIKVELNEQIFVKADPNMVQTIVRNLLSNAIKFSHRGGLVIIKTEVLEGNNAYIRIIDNGVGIEKSSLSKIFDISNTVHSAGTENEKSTGLGLILVKDFVEKNNGTIKIDSQKGKGTIVSFTLPAVNE
ncbi:MAG: tetratricopeptide repeat protein [Prolixibacteraceae bacterium]|jgi:signal transduction histidine kinase